MTAQLLRLNDSTPRSVDRLTSQRLRIAVISDAAAGRNGVGTYYEDLVAQLAPLVEDIALLAPGDGAHVDHQLFSIPMPGDSTQRLAYPRIRRLEEFLDEHSPQIVILPTLGAYAIVALRVARRRGIRVCMAHHTNFEKLVELYWPKLLAVPSRSLLRGLTKWMITRADCVINMNVESLEEAKRNGARWARIVGTPLPSYFFDTPRRPLCSGPFRVLFLGRLAAEKRVDLVLEAAARLPQVQFRVGGDGPMRAQVQAAAHRLPNLDYLGWLNRKDVLQVLDASDVLALPSSLETFGTVALEALARHRLVLVTRECGIAQWTALAEGLFAIEREEDLAGALLRLMRLPSDQRRATAEVGWRAAEQFQQETLNGWLHVLTELGPAAAPDPVPTSIAG
jgi:glycosyltransferase involved in cell wall biosynthesis